MNDLLIDLLTDAHDLILDEAAEILGCDPVDILDVLREPILPTQRPALETLVAVDAPENAALLEKVPAAILRPAAFFEANGVTDPSEIVRADGMPLARWGDPDEIAGPLVFLVSKLSSFMTGQTLIVDGGMNAHFPHQGANPMRNK